MLRMLRRLTEIAINCYRLVGLARDPYRPELHYMRGPGPKWHAKHQGIQRKPAGASQDGWSEAKPINRVPQARWLSLRSTHPTVHNKSPSSGGSNQFVSDSPPSITIAAPVT